MPDTAGLRGGEYAQRGDYHRTPELDWDYWPTYIEKMKWVRRQLDALPSHSRVLDVGCGEGVLVQEYRDRLDIAGVDLNYVADRVRQGSVLDLPFDPGTFDVVLCLDVLEHLALSDQARALSELGRVLTPAGTALLSLPNLAHIQSRVQFLVFGRLMRTASERKHPGDRPIEEYLRLLKAAGFRTIERRGVFPTIPGLTHLIRRYPRRLAVAHRWLTRLLPVPGWCFLNLIVARRLD